MNPEIRNIDQEIWNNELNSFVPQRIFDVHTHIYDVKFFDKGDKFNKQELWPHADFSLLKKWSETLFPQREIHYLCFGFPRLNEDVEGMNTFVGEEIRRAINVKGLMLIKPTTPLHKIEEIAAKFPFIGYKPYMCFVPKNRSECSVFDMINDEQLKLASKNKWIITLHLSKKWGMADRQNIKDILLISDKYPGIKIILAHCGRSFGPWIMEKGISSFKNLPNVYFDTSAVCNSVVFQILLDNIDHKRILFGTDNIPAGTVRGKYVPYGLSWDYLNVKNLRASKGLMSGEPTFVCYESLRALRYATKILKFNKKVVEDIFYQNAKEVFSISS